jgi:hypothetical protein
VNIHETNGRSVTEVLPKDSVDSIRRDMMAIREAHGATSEIGYRCSNIVELIQELQGATGEQREAVMANIEKQAADLQRLRAGLQ